MKRLLFNLFLAIAIFLASHAPMAHANTVTNVIVTFGQSNMSGEGANNQPYAGQDLLFGNDYVVKPFADPYDYDVNQVDTVSADASGGSFLPRVLTDLDTAAPGHVFMVVPCPKGGSSWAQWLPASSSASDQTNRTTLFGSFMWRLLQSRTNGVLLRPEGLLGETDAANGTSQETLETEIAAFGDAVYSDAGVEVNVSLIYHLTNVSQANQDAVNNAIRSVAATGLHHIHVSADLSIETADTPPHVTTDSGLSEAGDLVFASIIQELPQPIFYAPFRLR